MMEITIKINGRMVSVEVNDEVAECYDQGRRKAENLYHESAVASLTPLCVAGHSPMTTANARK